MNPMQTVTMLPCESLPHSVTPVSTRTPSKQDDEDKESSGRVPLRSISSSSLRGRDDDGKVAERTPVKLQSEQDDEDEEAERTPVVYHGSSRSSSSALPRVRKG